jgi:sulfide:quinone oxidoreductase
VERYTVVICGAGIAAVEGLLRLRALTGDALQIKMLAPNEELRYRPLAVDEPFALRGVRRYPLWRITQRAGAEWIQDAAETIDTDSQRLHTAGGQTVPYDALLLAVGARLTKPFEHVTVFDDEHADEAYRGIVQDVEEGYTRNLAFLLPEGPAWLLPAYELALMTAERAESMGEEGLGIDVLTPESAPLAALGETVSGAVSELRSASMPNSPRASRIVVPWSPDWSKSFPVQRRTNPVSSSPKAIARYRDLCVIALEAQAAR